jgi:hypothetical protein
MQFEQKINSMQVLRLSFGYINLIIWPSEFDLVESDDKQILQVFAGYHAERNKDRNKGFEQPK